MLKQLILGTCAVSALLTAGELHTAAMLGDLPKVKELLASGSVSNISTAARQAGISRSAFYKYKDYVFDAETGREAITVIATLLDKTGALQSLLSGISAAGASVVTITQSRPENGTAQVEVTVRTGTMQMTVEEMLTRLARQSFVVEVHRGT